MQAITLFLDEEDGPEAGESAGDQLVFDPRDPRSLTRARAMLQAAFGVSSLPPLCSVPCWRWVAAARRHLAHAVRRLKGNFGGCPASARTPT